MLNICISNVDSSWNELVPIKVPNIVHTNLKGVIRHSSKNLMRSRFAHTRYVAVVLFSPNFVSSKKKARKNKKSSTMEITQRNRKQRGESPLSLAQFFAVRQKGSGNRVCRALLRLLYKWRARITASNINSNKSQGARRRVQRNLQICYILYIQWAYS